RSPISSAPAQTGYSCPRHFHHRLRIALELQSGLLEVEPVSFLGHNAALHQLHDDVERLFELATLVPGFKPHLDRTLNEGTGPAATHTSPARRIMHQHQQPSP